MTPSLERTLNPRTISGDEAYDIINARRDEDYFRVDSLRDEFPSLAHQLGHQGLWLARADDNIAGTFKIRGAIVAMTEMQERGITTFSAASAGNHLTGCIAALNDGMTLNGFVPYGTPASKLTTAFRLAKGKDFQLHNRGNNVDETIKWSLAHPEVGAPVHPFDNINTIAGQGTLVDDILAEKPNIRHIVTAVGGAGMTAAMLQRLYELGRQDITIHAAQAEGSDGLSTSLDKNRVSSATKPNMRYRGSAVKHIGGLAFALCLRHHNNLNVFTVREEEVDTIIGDYELDRIALERESTPNYEPTTLVAVAGLARIAQEYPNDEIVVIGSGHNDTLWPVHQSYQSTNVCSGTFPK